MNGKGALFRTVLFALQEQQNQPCPQSKIGSMYSSRAQALRQLRRVAHMLKKVLKPYHAAKSTPSTRVLLAPLSAGK